MDYVSALAPGNTLTTQADNAPEQRSVAVPLTVTGYRSRYNTSPLGVYRTSLPELAEQLRAPPVNTAKKEELAFWHAAIISPGGRRRNADVESVTAAFLDHDGTEEELRPLLEALEKLGVGYLLLPSPSHFRALPEGKFKCRIIVAYTRRVRPGEHRRVWTWLNARARGALDRQTQAPSQGYCVPAVAPEFAAQWWIRLFEGAPLDVALVLGAVPEDGQKLSREPTDDERGRFAAIAEPELATYTAALPSRVEEGGRHRVLYQLAQRCRDFGVDPQPYVAAYNERACVPRKTEEEVERVTQGIDRYRLQPVGFELARATVLGHDHTPVIDRTLRTLSERAGDLYRRGGVLVCLTDDGIVAANEARLNELISHHVRIYQLKKAKGESEQTFARIGPPSWLAKELIARGSWKEVPELEAVTNVPVLRLDGSVLTTPGYDPASKLFYQPATDLEPDIPEQPTFEQGREALARVAGLFGQFPFETEAMRAAHLALMLTTVARSMIDGPVPVGIFDANRAQVGKSKLTAAIGMVMSGVMPPKKTLYSKPEKMSDELYAAGTAGLPVLYFDNVRNGATIESAELDGALTSMSITQRRRYTDVSSPVPFRPIVLISGNGVRVGGDLEARSLYVRLVSPLEDPTRRDDIEIHDLLGHIKKNRAGVVADMLTAWRAWIVAGRAGKVEPWHTFAEWSSVRQLLAWYGYPDPIETREALRALDDTTDVLDLLLAVIAREWPGDTGTGSTGGCTAKQLVTWLELNNGRDEEAEALKLGLCREADVTVLDAASVGRVLGRFRERVAKGMKLVKCRVGGTRRTGWTVRGA